MNKIFKMFSIFQIFKPKIAVFLVFVSLSSYLATGNGFDHTAILLFVSGIFASFGAASLNNYFDRDIDAIMVRTKNRLIPCGYIKPKLALFIGITLTSFGILIAGVIKFDVALFVFLGVFVYVVVYTLFLKRRSWMNIVLGGSAGSFSVLAGFAAGGEGLTSLALLISVFVFL